MSNFSTFFGISVGVPNCIKQSELHGSEERALESLKVGAEQQKQTADVECDTTQVFYIVYIYVLLYVYANVCASVCM